MKPKKDVIEDLQTDLRVFVSSTIKAERFDVVIPIMRKGLFLLDRLFPTNRGFRIFLLDPMENIIPKNVSLASERILILDDSARTGRTLMEAKQSIITNNSARDENIRIAVFMKHKDCQAPVHYWKVEFDDADATELYGLLSNYFDSLCHQLDPDHLVARGSIDDIKQRYDLNHFIKSVESSLEDLGSYYLESDSVCHLWGRTKFAVADLNPNEFGLGVLEPLWKEEGVFKVRFCLEPDWTLYVATVFCPEIRPAGNGKCDINSESKFCEYSEVRDEILCRDCINFNLTKVFAEKFIPVLKKELLAHGYSLKVSGVTWPEIQFKYEAFQERIFTSLKLLD